MWRIAFVSCVLVTSAAAEPYPVCMFGKRIDACQAVFLLEGGFRVGTSTTFTLDTGGLYNVTDTSAVGLTIGGLTYSGPPDELGETQAQWELVGKARYRYWVDEELAFDLAVGGGRNGPVAELAFEAGDVVAFYAGVDRFPTVGGHEWAANAGIRLGTYGLGVAAYALMTLLGSGKE